MNFKRGLKPLGFLLIAIGAFIIIIQPFSTTGAVIDISTAVSRIWFFAGLAMVAVGIFMSISLEGHINTGPRITPEYEIVDIVEIMRKAGRGEDVVFVLDSSGIINYGNELRYLIDCYPDKVYVPVKVIKELEKSKRGKAIIEGEFKDKDGAWKVKQLNPKKDPVRYKKFQKIVENTLMETKKHKDYVVMEKIVGEERVSAGVSDKELERYLRIIEHELPSKLMSRYNKAPTKQNKLWLLKKEYGMSKGDVGVVMTALQNALDNKKVEILAQDTHIRDSVRSLVNQYPDLKGRLNYIDYRRYKNKLKGEPAEYPAAEVA
ncbi:MAG: hypothetical protein PHH54_01825 [Candidatus Nanoarchaeia archaeon]|nr:hypothetical protein [Candidatus Nanoarchaeia archaeon]MDD5740701.1 hypothetical protein [Candidatus Nanoarchaeia archaeon]